MATDDYTEDEHRRISRAEIVPSRGNAIEWEEKKRARELDAAKEYAAKGISRLTPQMIEVLEAGLQSEDEGIRIKAALAVLDRLVPKMRAMSEQAEEIIEIVPESRRRLLEDIEEEMRKKLGE